MRKCCNGLRIKAKNGLVNPMDTNQYIWGSLISTAANTGDNIGQSVGGDTGDVISGTFKPEKGFAVLGRSDVEGWKKGVSFLAPGLGNMWAKKSIQKEKELAIKTARNQEALLNMPKPSEGVVPGVVNPYVLALGGLYNNNPKAYGGLETYDAGGLHEQNPNGGIPLGIGQNGKMNTVEEGEASFNFSDGKYVFSNRLILE